MAIKAITATRKFTFDAAHFLPGHKGKCQRIHGHQWSVWITVSRNDQSLISFGSSESMVYDFSDLKMIVNPIINELDHYLLNDVLSFRPTAENIAEFFYDRVSNSLPKTIFVKSIRVYESPDSYAEVTI